MSLVPPSGHAPVMAPEVVAALAPRQGGVYLDGTFGAGGYARAILAAASCSVIGLDRDPTAVERAQEWIGDFDGRLTVVESPFADVEETLEKLGVEGVDGFDLDLGVSSMQFDEADRGFSFRFDGPLSMRMDKGKPDASDVVNTADADDLAIIFKVYGEERHAKRIARAIVKERAEAAITTTERLAKIASEAQPPARGPQRIHPATRIFQALRIFVNDELGQLARALYAAERLLRPAGRLVVVTFHSLEDRIVKRFIADRAGKAQQTVSRHAPLSPDPVQPTFELLSSKPQTPGDAELEDNPRARSAKLRAAIRNDAPPSDRVIDGLLPTLTLSKPMQLWSAAQ